MCKFIYFVRTLIWQQKIIYMLRAEARELRNEVEESRDELLRIRTRLVRMRVGGCYYTESGTRWHVFNDCHSFRSSSRVLNKDGMCRVCWTRLQEETSGEVPTPPHGWNEDTDGQDDEA